MSDPNPAPVASLGMYIFPITAEATLRLWANIRENLMDRGIDAPTTLSNDMDDMAVWTHPNLVLSQTCGMPFRLFLSDRVQIVGTPNYGLDGCDPGFYRSAIVVRRDDPRTDIASFRDAVFAYNQTTSQSGYAAPWAHLQSYGFFFEHRLETGAHAASARAVADGRADIAALDAVTWQFLKDLDPDMSQLRVLDWTAPTPGLPLITGLNLDPNLVFEAVDQAIKSLTPAEKNTLGLQGLVRIEKADYLAIPNPPIG